MAGELIHREALDRILQRAAELQAGEHDIGDGLTEAELLALGKDVGIPGRYLRQAMLEERIRVAAPPAAGWWQWLAGPALLAAGRVVPGDRGSVERALAHGMEEEELLTVRRRFPDSTSWEAKRGAFASIQRALGSGGRRYALAEAAEIVGRVTPLESGFCHVQLSADVRPTRRRQVGGGAFLLALGAASSAVVGALFGAIAVFPAALLTIGAVAVMRRHRVDNERVQVGLEQVLDRLEHGEIRPEHALPGPRASAFLRIADELRKTFQ